MIEKYKKLKDNLDILERHNDIHTPIFRLTDGKTHEQDLIRELISDCRELLGKIENGTLIEVDKNLIGQEIIGIHHFTDGTHQLDLDENIVIGFSSCGVITWNATHCYNDEFDNGMFFIDNEEGKNKVEARLKELQE